MFKYALLLTFLISGHSANATVFYDILIKGKTAEYAVHIGFNDAFTGSQLKKTIANNEKIPADKQRIVRSGSNAPVLDTEIVGPGDRKGRNLVIYVDD